MRHLGPRLNQARAFTIPLERQLSGPITMTRMAKRLWFLLACTVATIILGIGLRFGHFGQPLLVRKYGGSMTWALMIFWIVSAFRRPQLVHQSGVWRAAVISGCIATAVEFAKLIHTPWLEAFRGTLPGILLLGRFFSWWDLVAYWVAIAAGALLDQQVTRRLRAGQDAAT